jgi:hypothetical protein
MYLGLQTQLGLAQHDYDSQVAAQHEFAIQQMMANQRDEQQKNAISILKEPGGGSFLASGNPLGMSLGGSPGAMTNLAQAGDTAQGAKNFQATMTGLNQGSQGGYQLAPGSAVPPGLPPGLQLTNLSPAMVQAANINAASRIAAASIGAGGKGPKDTFTWQNPAIPVPGGELTSGGSTSGIRTQADYDAAVKRATDRAKGIISDRSGGGATSLAPNPAVLTAPLPPAQQDTGNQTDTNPLSTVPSAPGVAKGPGTKATPAAPAQPSGAYNTIDTNSPLGKAAQVAAKKFQDGVKTAADAGDPRAKAAYDDMNAGMKGGAFTVIMKPDGGVYVQGAKPGTGYFLGNPQGAKQ